MKKLRLVTAPLVALAIVVLASVFTFSERVGEVGASFENCPETPPEARYQCLLEEEARIEEQLNELEGAIAAEDFEQLGLYEQITYLDNLITETELTIAELELNIEKKNVEVQILGEEILELQNEIDTLTQEINFLELTIEERTQKSYKLTFMSPFEILLDSQDLETVMRRMKYLVEAKKKDRELLTDMSVSRGRLEDEEVILAEKRKDVQDKRNEIESERAELAEEKNNLESQQAQQQILLAESQQREQAYFIKLEETRVVQSALDAEISSLIAQMYKDGEIVSSGPVSQGAIIGKMGSTGCSSGPHVHFCINDGNPHAYYWYMWGNIDPLSGPLVLGPNWWRRTPDWTYYYVTSGTMQVPIAGPVVYTYSYHQGLCIDISSLYGQGAFVYAAHGGTLYKGTESVCGGKYAIVEHPDGYVTSYLHLMPE